MEDIDPINATNVFINGTWWCLVSDWIQGDQNETFSWTENGNSTEYLAPCDSLPTANSTYIEEEDMSVWLDSFWTILFSSMIAAAIAGNSIVIWIVIGKTTFFVDLFTGIENFLGCKTTIHEWDD